MSKVVAQSIFNQTVVERNWRNHLTSAIVHVVIIGGAFLLVVPAVTVLKPVTEHVTLIAPIPQYHPKIVAPKITHVAKLIEPPVPATVPKLIPPPIIPKPVPQPVVKVIPPPSIPVTAQPHIAAEMKPDLPPPPKPAIKTGLFQDMQVAKAAPVQKQLTVGGFGDPYGAHATDNPKPAPVLVAKVGAFDAAQGAGQSGGGGHMDAGSVKQAGFGSVTSAGTPGGTGRAAAVRATGFGDGVQGGTAHSAGTVRQTGFGDVAAVAAPQRHEASTAPSAFTPVEILFKPRPSYSAEARDMRLEGQVSLEVVFQASGSVKVIRVIKGLGHGLDEAAQQAAMQVRFKPATRSGSAVDTSATISITFELT